MSTRKVCVAAIVVVCVGLTATRALSKQTPRGGGFRGHDDGGQASQAGPQTVIGTITGGDASSGTITISAPNGASLTFAVSSNTPIYTETAISVSALNVGDRVQVHGIPTAITASSIVDGALPQSLGAGPLAAKRGANQLQSGQGVTQQAFASAAGTVASTSPLTINLGSGVTVSLKLASSAKVSKISTMSYSSLKVGDKLVANVQQGSTGAFVAQEIGINVEMPGR